MLLLGNAGQCYDIGTKEYYAAKFQSIESKKPLMVVFWGSGCPYCVKLEKEVLTQPAIKEILTKYVVVSINAWDNREISAKYLVRGVPMVILEDYKSDKHARFGYLPKETIAEILTSFLEMINKENSNAR